MLTYLEYIKRINENLLITYPIDSSIDLIEKILPARNIDVFKIENENNKLKLTFFNEKNTEEINYLEIQNIFDLINNVLGYETSYYKLLVFDDKYGNVQINNKYNKEKLKNIYINKKILKSEFYFDAKFDTEISLPDKLYHLTLDKYINKILKIGLIPKSKNKMTHHPDRIYFCFDIDGCKDLIKSFKRIEYNDNKFIILEIDCEQMKKDNKEIKIFSDPNYIKKGVYTLENINPKYLSIK